MNPGRSGTTVLSELTNEGGNHLTAVRRKASAISEKITGMMGVRPMRYLDIKPPRAGWVVRRTGP